MQHADVVVIGAGNAGLAAAGTLAKKGVRVLVLERHNIPGGCATSFCRGRFEFETALHQLSGVGTDENRGPLWRVLQRLDVMDKVEFIVGDELYRAVVPGEFDITLKADKQGAIDGLQRQFPHEKENIAKFFEFVYAFFMEVVGLLFMRDAEPSREKYPRAYKYLLKPTQEVLQEYFSDEQLLRVLTAYWGYWGLPPSQMPFSDWALMLLMYIEYKPQHIKGGSQALSNAIADTILSHGGTIRYNCPVKKIVVEDGKVQGVVTAGGEEIRASMVLSNASTLTTYLDLIGPEHVPEQVFHEMRGSSIGTSAMTIYLGFDRTPDELGITNATTFIGGVAGAEREYDMTKTLGFNEEWMLGLTCYTKMDPSFSPPGTTMAVLLTLQYMEPWLRVPPAQYAVEKHRTALAMLTRAETVYPGLRDHIEEREVSTPITHARYLGHPGGAFYGFDQYLKDSDSFITPKPPIDGLHLAGTWVNAAGFQPTLDGGARAGRRILKQLEG